MHLLLYREYDAAGVNGALYYNGMLLRHTIELPWLNNQPNHSCIPEGTYLLQKRWSPRHKWHLEVTGVKARKLILVHPASNALQQLRGCIAPVGKLTGKGQGTLSWMAFTQLTALVYPALEKEMVLLTILKK